MKTLVMALAMAGALFGQGTFPPSGMCHTRGIAAPLKDEWRREGGFDRPSPFQPRLEARPRDAHQLTPFSGAARNSFQSKKPIIPLVPILGGSSCPTKIAHDVALGVVYPVNREASRRVSEVGVEPFESAISFCQLHSAIVTGLLTVGIYAAVDHCAPVLKGRRVAHPVSCSARFRDLGTEASAGFGIARAQVPSERKRLGSAVTQAIPHGPARRIIWSPADNGQPTVFSPDHFNRFRHFL